MKKLVIVLSIVLCIFVLFLVFDFKKTDDSKTNNYSTCNLNVENCTQKFENNMVEISFTPKPVKAMVPVTLRITNLGEYENLSVALHGVNMNMGEIKSDFVKKGNVHEASFMFTSCVHDMLYEGVLYSNNNPINFKFKILLRNI